MIKLALLKSFGKKEKIFEFRKKRNFFSPDSRGGSFDLSISMATTLIQMIQMGQFSMSWPPSAPNEMTLMHWDSSLRRSG